MLHIVQDVTVSTERTIPVYLEVGSKRVFAGALDWPGWSRSGRDEAAALSTLVAYGERYRAAVGDGAHDLTLPAHIWELEVKEQLQGNATTDFGAPAIAPAHDSQPLDETEAERLAGLLRACWATFDRVAASALGIPLAKGARGGGRELDAIARHVLEAEQAYLAALGGRYRPTSAPEVDAVAAGTRAAVHDTLMARARGDPLPPSRRTKPAWTPRYFVRRAAWHVLDHTWEIEDRAGRL